MAKPKLKYKYCVTHKQKYYATLNRCPICAGVEMGGSMVQLLRSGKEITHAKTEAKTTKQDNLSATKERIGSAESGRASLSQVGGSKQHRSAMLSRVWKGTFSRGSL